MDSGIFVALANVGDQDHKAAAELGERIRLGERGTPYTSDYVADEVITTALVRTRNQDIANTAGELILGSEDSPARPLVKLVIVDKQAFEAAWASFKAKKYRGLSFTDQTILAQMKEFHLETRRIRRSRHTGIVGFARSRTQSFGKPGRERDAPIGDQTNEHKLGCFRRCPLTQLRRDEQGVRCCLRGVRFNNNLVLPNVKKSWIAREAKAQTSDLPGALGSRG